MAGDLKIYDPNDVSASIAGLPMSGWADGEFIRIERESNAFDDVAGTDGEVTRSKSNDDRATITFLLMQSSDANDLLSALYNTDKNTPGGAGVGAFLVRDGSGRALFTAEKAWIQKSPDVSLDRTATAREWTIRCASILEFHGGN